MGLGVVREGWSMVEVAGVCGGGGGSIDFAVGACPGTQLAHRRLSTNKASTFNNALLVQFFTSPQRLPASFVDPVKMMWRLFHLKLVISVVALTAPDGSTCSLMWRAMAS